MAEKNKKNKVNEKLIPEVNIGLVGHVDHGKTSLTEAMSGKWTDVHTEELKRGITLRLGYADVTIYKCKKCGALLTKDKCLKCLNDCKPLRTISLVDAPGHETLMATVLAGTSMMDGALLLIAANEGIQAQTKEHLMALDIAGVKNIIIVQNKIDLVTKEEAMKRYKEIKEFVKGTVAENAPVIPVSARQNINIDALLEAIEENIPTPERDKSKDPIFLVARSFDVNNPGIKPEKLVGGVLGGTISQGILNVGDEIEIKPGLRTNNKWQPLKTKIVGLQKAGKNLDSVGPGGLVGLMTELDPSLTKSDSLAGSVAGYSGKLPPVKSEISFKLKGINRKDIDISISKGDILMIVSGVSKTVGVVVSIDKNINMKLKLPVCVEKGYKVAVSKQIKNKWVLVGLGVVA